MYLVSKNYIRLKFYKFRGFKFCLIFLLKMYDEIFQSSTKLLSIKKQKRHVSCFTNFVYGTICTFASLYKCLAQNVRCIHFIKLNYTKNIDTTNMIYKSFNVDAV